METSLDAYICFYYKRYTISLGVQLNTHEKRKKYTLSLCKHIQQSMAKRSHSLVDSSPAKWAVCQMRRAGHAATHVATPVQHMI
jgi:hypothetical protein